MASTFHQIIVRYNLCTDKSSLKICVDFTCCLRCFCSFCNSPCTDFRLAGCQIADKYEQLVAGFDQFFQSPILLIRYPIRTSSLSSSSALQSPVDICAHTTNTSLCSFAAYSLTSYKPLLFAPSSARSSSATFAA